MMPRALSTVLQRVTGRAVLVPPLMSPTFRVAMAVMALSLSVAPATHAATLRVFFAPTGLSVTSDTNSVISGPPALANPIIQTQTGAKRFYVWAQMNDTPTTQTWNGVSLNFKVTGSAQITGRKFWNYTNGAYVRWQATNQGTLNGSSTELTGVNLAFVTSGKGVNNTAAAIASDGQYDATTDATLIGYLTVQGDGEAFIGVGPSGIARQGSIMSEPVDFGFGDESDVIDGNDFGVYSSLADGTAALPALRLFFANGGLSSPGDTNSVIAGSPALTNPLVATSGGPQRVYVWAQMNGPLSPQTWNGISLNFKVTGAAQITGRKFWNYTNGTYVRWQGTSQGTLNGASTVLTGVNLVFVTSGKGVNNTAAAIASDGQYDATTDATLLGYLTVQGDGEAFIGVGPSGIARQGSTMPEPVDFGFGDESDVIDGNDGGAYSSAADAVLSTTTGLDVGGDPSTLAAARASALRVYPNPASRGDVTILFRVPLDSRIVASLVSMDVAVFDVTGRRIGSVASGRFPAGIQTVTWDRRDESGRFVAPGTYFLRLTSANGYQVTERMTIVR